MAVEDNERQRFYVEMVPGETTIVSWKKLVRQAKEKDQYPPTTKRVLDCSEVAQCSDSVVRSESPKHKSRATSSGYQQKRKRRVEMTKVEGEKNDDPSSTKHLRLEKMSTKATNKTSSLFDKSCSHSTSAVVKDNQHDGCLSAPYAVRNASIFPLKTKLSLLPKLKTSCSENSRMEGGISGDSSDTVHQNYAQKCFALKINSGSIKSKGEKKAEVSSKSQHSGKSGGSREWLDVVSPDYKSSLQHLKRASSAINDATPVRPFSTVVELESAIRELEETVAEALTAKSLEVEALDVNASWRTIESGLPVEVKLKLGEVARIAQSSQDTMSEDLVACLVTIIGKLVCGKSLKSILRKLVMLKLSAVMDKAEQYKETKDEILAMVANRLPNLEAVPANNAGTKEELILARSYKLDSAIEDRLCDLYDLRVQGLDRDKGVEAQKIFTELVQLWPEGVMDYCKLRRAISRTRSRRVSADKNQGQKVIQRGPRLKDGANKNIDLHSGPKGKVKSSGASHKLISSFQGTAAAKKKKSIEQDSLKGRSQISVSATPCVTGTELKKLVPEKTNMKIRFFMKQENRSHKPDELPSNDKSNRPTASAPLTCKQQSWSAAPQSEQ